jgi:hypothetical protein
VVGNTAAIDANIFIKQNVFKLRSVFGSVIADPLGGGTNCGFQGVPSVTSNGDNFSDDSSCLLTNTAGGDRQSAGSPGLAGAVANNGGSTPTLLPQAGSPLIDFIPAARCQFDGASGVTTDQRGITRPQGAGCDIGAVEVQAAIVAAPRFTG